MRRREKGKKEKKGEKSKEERRKTAKCHLCGEIGHIKFDCPKDSPSKLEISKIQQIQTPQVLPSQIEIKNIDVILRYCRDFRFAYITFKNGDKNSIHCTYEKKKGLVHALPYERDKLSDIKYKSVKYFWKNITKYGTPIGIEFVLYYNVMIQMLSEKNLVKHTYVAEDKRSGCNLMKILEIEGVAVDHNAHADCVRSEQQKQFYSQIVALFQKNIIAPRNCRKQILFILWINKNRLWPFIPKDVLLLIVKRVWRTRRHRFWITPLEKKATLQVLY